MTTIKRTTSRTFVLPEGEFPDLLIKFGYSGRKFNPAQIEETLVERLGETSLYKVTISGPVVLASGKHHKSNFGVRQFGQGVGPSLEEIPEPLRKFLVGREQMSSPFLEW